jgi:hypothetical protein
LLISPGLQKARSNQHDHAAFLLFAQFSFVLATMQPGAIVLDAGADKLKSSQSCFNTAD